MQINYHKKFWVHPKENSSNICNCICVRIIFLNNLLYISDKLTNTLFVFDNTGKFIRVISNKGNGPGEYINITDFAVNPENSEILKRFYIAVSVENLWFL